MSFDPATISTAVNASHQKNESRPVVVMPSGGILNGKKYGAGQKAGQSSSAPRSQTPGRDGRITHGTAEIASRPTSAAISRSRDIVQEVYDRMGVNYVRGQSTFEFDDKNSSILIHAGTKSVTKSPSHNRTNIRYMYNATTETTVESDARSVRSNVSSANPAYRWSSSRSVSTNPQNNQVVAYPSSTRSAAASASRQQQLPSYLLDNSHDYEEKDDRDGNNDDSDRRLEDRDEEREEEGGRQSPVSIKSKISVFSGNGGKPSANTKKPFASSIVAQKIYAAEHKKNHFSKAKVSTLNIATSGPKGDRNEHSTTPSQRSLKSGVVNNFLAAINKQSCSTPTVVSNVGTIGRPSDVSAKSIPAEIVPANPNNHDCDDHSIAASSVSGEDFAAATGTTKHEASSSIDKVRSATAASLLTKEIIERMIEDTLQAKFGELQEILETRIRRMEDDTNARLDEMENKLHALMYDCRSEEVETIENEASSAKASVVVKSSYHQQHYRPF
ncbi:hypothetical protein IV203_037185 [Nitzschia inconspicua]|uniref:Uncharacterized protein n=1 Tax=Nitzschia inconspicua TaxID=303405 RepID=A0A9K3LKP0_9STRA|nr:hypothetical protein IV203_037185 [Nitzschia inconspicua]